MRILLENQSVSEEAETDTIKVWSGFRVACYDAECNQHEEAYYRTRDGACVC